MSIRPRGTNDSGYMKSIMNDEYVKQQTRLNDKDYKSGNPNYEIQKRSYFRMAGLFLATNWLTVILFGGILGLFIYIIFR